MKKTFDFIQWLRAKNFISCTPQFIKETGSNSIVEHLEYLYNVFGNEFGNVNLDLRTILENSKDTKQIWFESTSKPCVMKKPKQYQIGIDTFERAEANLSKEEILAICKFNIDKYCWRQKDQDKEDFQKIIKYAEWALKNL